MEENVTSQCPFELADPVGKSGVEPVLEKYESALLMILGFGGFSIILALVHNALRKHIFHDEHNLDTTFDAGGNVSLSLTAVTVASQLIWPGDILHSATLTAKNGIAGPFWYAVGIIFNIFIFPIFSVQFKTKAPGAKTYLQVIHARFGRNAHIVFCCFALVTNLVITIGILLAGRATIQSLTKDASDEFTLLTMAVLFGSYSLIGGLGTTFYVSYFNACLVFILLIVFVVKIWHNTDEDYVAIGNVEKMYNAITCIKGPEENYEHSYLTFRSGVAFLFGVIEVFVSSAVTYCDQASWQSRIAAKPTQGVYGFLLGGLMWFAIPSTMATTTGLAYLALSAENKTNLLTYGQIDEGLVTPLIAETVLGSAGGILVLTMGAMALMSTGSGEVMAMSSIIVYDIYQTYIRPFRRGLTEIDCVLCGKKKKDVVKKKSNKNNDTSRCECPDVSFCQPCKEDMKNRSFQHSNGIKMPYTCTTHGRYREYQDSLIGFKDWCIVMVTISIIPLGLVVFETGIDLNWIFYSGAIVTIPCFPPVILSIIWVKATGKGLISGGIAGLICGVTATLVAASFYEGGLNLFLQNTVQNYAILAGTCSSFGASLLGCIIVSLFTNDIKSIDDENLEWQKMYDIENPLNPWELNYREELKGLEYEGKPTFEQMAATFKRAKLLAYIGGAACIVAFAVVIPGIMAMFPKMDLVQFSFWIWGTQIFAVVMALIVVIAPMTEEIYKIMKEYRKSACKMNGGYGQMNTVVALKVEENESRTPVTNV